MNATMTQNVVTYTVVVTTDNSSGKLLPYLTANVSLRRPAVGRAAVPNAALRWKPQASRSTRRPTRRPGRDRGRRGPRLRVGGSGAGTGPAG